MIFILSVVEWKWIFMDLSFSENAFYHICPRVEMNSHESAFGRKCFFLLSILMRIEEILNVVSLYALYVTGFYFGKDRKDKKSVTTSRNSVTALARPSLYMSLGKNKNLTSLVVASITTYMKFP